MKENYGGDVILTCNLYDNSLVLFDLEWWEKLERKLQDLSNEFPVNRQAKRIMLSHATELRMDRRNKLEIPQVLCERGQFESTFDLAILNTGRSARLMPSQTWQNVYSEPNGEESKAILRGCGLGLTTNKKLIPTLEIKEYLSGKYNELLACSASKNYREFELVIGEIISAHNVGIVEVTQYSKDDGIDLIIYSKSDSEYNVLFVQIKAGNKLATVSDLRELVGTMSLRGGNHGLLIAAKGFTSGSINESEISKGTKIKASTSEALNLSKWIEARFSES